MNHVKIMKDGVFFAYVADVHTADRLVYAYRATYMTGSVWTYEFHSISEAP